MATPRADSYTVASGAAVYAGITAPAPAPAPAGAYAWMTAPAVNTWSSALPGSIGAGGASVQAYSGYALDGDMRVWIVGAGGHTDSFDNRVVSYDLGKDAPTGWVINKPSSTVYESNVPYYPDGLPNSTHTYDYTFWSPALRRIIRFGAFGIYQTGFGSNTIDAFNVDTNEWDPPYSYPFIEGTTWLNAAYNYGATIDKSTGNIHWAVSGGTRMWVPGQTTFTTKTTNPVGLVRFPNCFDSLRTAIFSLSVGDGQGAGTDIRCFHTINPSQSDLVKRVITLTGPGIDAIIADQPQYAGMDYDVLRDKFMFAYGTNKQSGYATDGPLRIIEITPNSGTTWSTAVYTAASGSPGNVSSSGINGRFKYVHRNGVGGYVVMADKNNGMFFLRTT